MWSVGFLGAVALLIISITHWVYKWRNPKDKGRLPPGSMGLPYLGETIQFFVRGKSVDVPPFIKNRIQRYGPLFKTRLAGRPVVISTDPESNRFIFQQEGKTVELWYLDSFMKFLGPLSSSIPSMLVHKYLRNLILTHYGTEGLKKYSPVIEEKARRTLRFWSSQEVIEVKDATTSMICDLSSKKLFGNSSTMLPDNIKDEFSFFQGLITFPFNIPGTTFHKCLKAQKNILKMLREMLRERLVSSKTERSHGDFLDQVIEEMKKEGTILTEDAAVYLIFILLFASFETISAALTLLIKFVTDHPAVLKELREEHEAILRNKKDVGSPITWEEYKSMKFTSQVINETLRLGNFSPGIFRKVLSDIQLHGFTIPAGWTIMACSISQHLDPDKYEDPFVFNPWRWEAQSSNNAFMGFTPFGGGIRLCVGAEYSKLQISIFLHHLVTKYRWTTVKGGDIVRTPIIFFPNGFHIQISEITA